MGSIKIIHPGLLATVQDRGRPAFQRFGVSVSGAMDPFASEAANFLVGNDAGEAVLEATLMGPKLEMLGDCVIAVAGADMAPALDGVPVPMWQAFYAPKGSILSLSAIKSGARSYLAFAGGIDVPQVMGSRATYMKAAIGGLEGRALKAGDILKVNRTKVPLEGVKLVGFRKQDLPVYQSSQTLRVVMGPQDDYFTSKGINSLLHSTYTVSQKCDRMGYRLEGEAIEHKSGADIISDGIIMGSVQVPGNGQPIILMADRQTTGGYTKIATVISTDLPLVAQAKPGDRFSFQPVTVAESHEALKEGRARWEQMKRNCTVPLPPPKPAALPVAIPAPPPASPLPPAQPQKLYHCIVTSPSGERYEVYVNGV